MMDSSYSAVPFWVPRHDTEDPPDPEDHSRGIRFMFEWRDLWVGLFLDTAKRRIYILPIPIFGVRIDY